MSWAYETLGNLITESRIPAINPDPNRRIRVKLNVLGVEKRPFENEVAGATKQFQRKAGQFIYGKQNFHKGAFGIIPDELDGFETSADIPSFDVREDCLPEWIFYYFKIGNRYLEMVKYARGVGSKRIHPEQIADVEIPLPSIKEQKRLIKEFKQVEDSSQNIASEFINQEDLLSQLRQSFLREAMQGKLVKQDPKDGHAKDLREKIKAEKAKSGRKEKELPPIKPEEIPFEIPENWVWCRLTEACLQIVDCPHSTPKYLTEETGYYGIDTTCIDDYGTITRLRNLSKEGYESRIARLIPTHNDIVYAREGSIGLAAFIPNKKKICLGQRVMLFRCSSGIMPEFLRMAVTEGGYKDRLLEKHRGMGAKHVNVKDIVSSIIPLPPLPEQTRIVKKVNDLTSICDRLQQSIIDSKGQNELLLQQVLKEALSNSN